MDNIKNVNHDMLSLISSADMVGKAVFLILGLISIWTWAIIFTKFLSFKILKEKIRKFEDMFRSGQMLDQIYNKVITERDTNNPLGMIFVSAMHEWKSEKKPVDNPGLHIAFGVKDRIRQSMEMTRNDEIEALEKNLGFLATINSSATYIGLFGTVWGIMHSFQSIASAKNTNLAIVAPGIAEALLATACGLVVAIPAGIFYNYFMTRLNHFIGRIDNFTYEIDNLMSRMIDNQEN